MGKHIRRPLETVQEYQGEEWGWGNSCVGGMEWKQSWDGACLELSGERIKS